MVLTEGTFFNINYVAILFTVSLASVVWLVLTLFKWKASFHSFMFLSTQVQLKNN